MSAVALRWRGSPRITPNTGTTFNGCECVAVNQCVAGSRFFDAALSECGADNLFNKEVRCAPEGALRRLGVLWLDVVLTALFRRARVCAAARR